jgi:hypothetical protein
MMKQFVPGSAMVVNVVEVAIMVMEVVLAAVIILLAAGTVVVLVCILQENLFLLAVLPYGGCPQPLSGKKVFKNFYAEVCLPNQWLHFLFHPDNEITFPFLFGVMIAFCEEHSIVIDLSVKYKSSTNGTAESTIRDLTVASMCNFGSTSLHKSLFNLCWNYTEDVANSVPTPPSYLSPNFLTDGSETNVDDHRSFGARCYLLNHSTVKPSTNVEAPGHEAIWLGYGDHRTTHMLLDVKTNVVSKFPHGNVVFDEFNTEAHYNDRDVNEQLEFLNEIDDAEAPVSDLPTTAAPVTSPLCMTDDNFLSGFYATTLSTQVSMRADMR